MSLPGRPRLRDDGWSEQPDSSPVLPPKIPVILTKPPSLDKILASGAEHSPKPAGVSGAELLSPVVASAAANAAVAAKLRDDASTPAGIAATSGRVSSMPVLGHGIPALLQAGEAIGVPQQQLQQQPPVYQIQQRSATVGGGEQPPPVHVPGSSVTWTEPLTMTQPVRLIDEYMHWCENAVEHLTDQSDYLVVGFVGPQCVGKSFLASLLAGNKHTDPEKSFVFKLQNRESLELCSHQTSGIQLFTTRERILVLDSQPLLSPSLLSYFIQNERKYSSEYSCAENYVELQCLQQLMFLMTVCHVLVIVDDWFADPNLLRFIQTAEMLKPQMSHSTVDAEDSQEYYPSVVFAQNRCSRQDYTIENYLSMQKVLQVAFGRSKLQCKGRVNMGHELFPELGDQNPGMNLYLIPEAKCRSDEAAEPVSKTSSGCYPDFGLTIQRFCNHILAMPRPPLAHVTLTEKNWLQYASRSWESIKKSQYLSEYNRLLS